MFDDFDWITVDGEGEPGRLTLFALSTCAFCHSAKKWLAAKGLAHRYLDLDLMGDRGKAALKDAFRGAFGRRPAYPTLVIDGKRFLVGFVKEHWEMEIAGEAGE